MTEEEQVKEEVREIEVEKITFNPHQPRKSFCQEGLEELASSIKHVGLIHPPVVRPLPADNTSSYSYELISGERRFRAVQLAGLKKIAVLVRISSSCLSAQAALIENVQRIDLSPMEIAKGLHSLIEEFGFNQEHLAQRIGKKRSTIANYLRLLSLPPNVQQSLNDNLISMGHAKGILALDDPKKQILLHELILRDNLNVRKTEELAKKLSQNNSRSEKPPEAPISNSDPHLVQLSEHLQRLLGTKVTIQNQGDKGKLCIDYYSLDDLDRLLNMMGMDET